MKGSIERVYSYSMTEIYKISTEKSTKFHIIHTGSMGNTEKTIKTNVERFCGRGSFKTLIAKGKLSPKSSPSYYWELIVPAKDFPKSC